MFAKSALDGLASAAEKGRSGLGILAVSPHTRATTVAMMTYMKNVLTGTPPLLGPPSGNNHPNWRTPAKECCTVHASILVALSALSTTASTTSGTNGLHRCGRHERWRSFIMSGYPDISMTTAPWA